jgi:alpha-galactosidase
MIIREKELFVLNTKDTTYCFRIMPSGHLEHLYYGKRIDLRGGYQPLVEKVEFLSGAMLTYSQSYPKVGLEDLCLEMSSYGKGDIREPFIEMTHADGATTCDFLFKEARILDKKKELVTLPSAYLEEDEGSQKQDNSTSQEEKQGVSLEIELYDKSYQIALILTYSTFYESNVITRSASVINESDQEVKVERIMSNQLDLEEDNYIVSSFRGAWAREMNRYEVEAKPGIVVIDTKAGISSNRCNPFFMVSKQGTSEEQGDCYGFNLIYSGNHYAACEVNSWGKLRVIQGIQPSEFRVQLKPGESFETPESVMTYSHQGFTGMSHNMHHFIRNHIVRGEWKKKPRPILINSWEANYFKFNEGKLLKLAKEAKNVGIELFVLDDGWFGSRNDDTSSLGDWYENKDKLRGGLKPLAEKINALGMDFGIWVEPEMINEDSDCFRLHPDWAVKLQKADHSLGRNQMILDLTKEEVCDYIIKEMTRVFSSANITYVKWDMNRIFSDRYSSALSPEQQQEFGHRYVLGLYRVLDKLTKRFPHILFESCASGGNRFDLGMLCYMPQIWASDNTDAISRSAIQTGYSFGYPMSVIGAHVSAAPNHQTLRNTSLETRFEVAAFGLMGYELNLVDLKTEEKESIVNQVNFYKQYRYALQFGDYYRIKNGEAGIYQWISVSPDQKQALGLYLQKEAKPNSNYGKFRTIGLAEDKKYHVTNRQHIFNMKEFGDLINMISPIHIKKDSIAHNIIAILKKMPGEVEDSIAFGSVFNHAGIKLKQGFSGTGYNEEIRLFQDYASRLYIWEEIKNEKI